MVDLPDVAELRMNVISFTGRKMEVLQRMGMVGHNEYTKVRFRKVVKWPALAVMPHLIRVETATPFYYAFYTLGEDDHFNRMRICSMSNMAIDTYHELAPHELVLVKVPAKVDDQQPWWLWCLRVPYMQSYLTIKYTVRIFKK